jgi:hypothetical protein
MAKDRDKRQTHRMQITVAPDALPKGRTLAAPLQAEIGARFQDGPREFAVRQLSSHIIEVWSLVAQVLAFVEDPLDQIRPRAVGP